MENQLDMAKALLREGFDASKVAQITKIPLETILNISH